MPLFGKSKAGSALLALEALEHPAEHEHTDEVLATLTPSATVTDELKRDQQMRASLQLVPDAHYGEEGLDSGELVREVSAKRAADKMASKSRRRWLAMHTEAIEEANSPRDGELSPYSPPSVAGGGAALSLDPESGEDDGGITPVPDLARLSVRSFAVAAAPTPEQYADLGQRKLRNMQADAAVAGMSRGRTTYFRTTSLDWLFFLRNEHPLLSCVISHPLHPFEKGAHAKFLAVIVLFGVFTSVMTLHNVCKAQPVS